MTAVSKHPDYQTKRDEYTGAITAAKAAGDELAEVRAELHWRDTQETLRDDLDKRETAKAAEAAEREALKADFPRVPEVAYAHLNDPKAMRQVAEAIAASLPPEVTPTAGWPRPTTQGQPPAPKTDKYQDPNYVGDLNRRAWSGERRALEEVKDFTINRILGRIDDTREMSGADRVHQEHFGGRR